MRRLSAKTYWLGAVLGCVVFWVSPLSAATVLVEAEGFDGYGGWVLDQQFMDQMGSPYLLAHGLGVPVANAAVNLTLPETGTYYVWARTRDWVGPWKGPDIPAAKRAEGTPGEFQILINGAALPVVFGTEQPDWHWQAAGPVVIAEPNVLIELHDLTGFEGRCDAIVLSTEANLDLPNEDPALGLWRRDLLGLPAEPVDAGRYDLVVVGGGMAGTCASLKAARLGLKVALVQDRPVLGGNNSSDVRVWLGGNTNYEPFPRIGDVVRELEPAEHAHYGPTNTAEIYEDAKRIGIVQAEANISLFLNHRVNEVEMSGNRIAAVIAQDVRDGRRRRVAGGWFLDSTGDGCVGFLAGADYDITMSGHMGRCNLWNVLETGQATDFPVCPWALHLDGRPFPYDPPYQKLGVWYWESGFDHDPIVKSEYIRDWNFRVMYGAWDELKNGRGLYPTYRLNWAAYISGKRESRRLLGDVILTKTDLTDWVEYPDGCVPASWSIDLHLPDPAYDDGFEGDEFISKAYYTNYTKPYWIPYRCLYSRNIDNLFMAGRDISVTHEALGAVRVMRTGGMMGEIVGMAASLCRRYNTTSRGVYTHHLSELKNLMIQAYLLRWLERIGPNSALTGQVAVSGYYNQGAYPKENVNDGAADINDNNGRWLSAAADPPDDPDDWVEFAWPEPIWISACCIMTGWNNGSGAITSPMEDFVLQVHDGSSWQDIEQTRTVGNTKIHWDRTFAAVRCDRIRLLVTATPGDIARIWEIEFYHPVADANYDGQVDLRDLALQAANWLASSAGLSGDVNDDTKVNLADYGLLAMFWQWP
ncbi:MAG: FAD-dependent oxidoreductase [Sedimentisphaerales bacterium]|nr:FAD-dependent oxidoreductase [Sedimentisphaerales bacterium]